MSIDFQQIREQINHIGKRAPARENELMALYDQANQLLHDQARDLDRLISRVQYVVKHFDPFIRCAVPVTEPLDFHFISTDLPSQLTVIAADGSQIAPDRHAAVDYCLINVGAIQMRLGLDEPPKLSVSTRLFYDQDLFTSSGTITDATLALMRDLNERKLLAELASQACPPVITFTDGQMELWGRASDGLATTEFQKFLDEYLTVLEHLWDQNIVTSGYVDKPAANHVVRLLELGLLSETELPKVREIFPLRGVRDNQLFLNLLAPGERSAVFRIQSKSAGYYRNSLSLHFFYLNVGREDHPWLARVEVPAWVATDKNHLNCLQAVIVQQCQMIGSRPYPYVLHRAHEVALVTLEEKQQIEQMITSELRRHHVAVGEISQKQALKEVSGRRRYTR